MLITILKRYILRQISELPCMTFKYLNYHTNISEISELPRKYLNLLQTAVGLLFEHPPVLRDLYLAVVTIYSTTATILPKILAGATCLHAY